MNYDIPNDAVSFVALVWVFWIGYLLAWLVKKSKIVSDFTEWFRHKSTPVRILVVCAFTALSIFAGTKGGGNAPLSMPPPPPLLQVVELPPEPSLDIVSVNTNSVSFRTASSNAVEVATWRIIGGTEMGVWIESPTNSPMFMVGTNPIFRCYASASGSVSFESMRRPPVGTALPDGTGLPVLCPLRAPLGFVPEANLASNVPPSRFWHDALPGGGRVLTWENALVDRLPGRPVSLQVELRPSGDCAFRYDFQEELDPPPTNFVMGVQMGTNGVNALSLLGTNLLAATVWNVEGEPITNGVSVADFLCTNGVLRTPASFELRWKNTTGLDPEADTDNDGLTDWAETFLWGTDPNHADTDGDGIADNVELMSGKSPVDYDIDHDGLVDGLDPHPDVFDGNGYGTSDLWVQYSFTNATDLLVEGYESYVARICSGEMMRGTTPSGTSAHPEVSFFCLEVVVSELPVAGRALIVAGPRRLVVNDTGTYRLPLEKGTSHVLRTDAPGFVTFRCDDPWPEIVQPKTDADGYVSWPASGIHVIPSTHHYYTTGEDCTFWANCLDCFDGNASSWNWSSDCPDLAFDTPHAASCTVQWTGQSCSWGTASLVVSCMANGQTLSTTVWVTFGSYTTPQPHLSASFPSAFFVNDDDDDGNGISDWDDQTASNDDDIVPFTVAFSADDPMTGVLTIETFGAASGFRAWTDSSKTSSVEIPASFTVDTPTSTATWTLYFEAQNPSGSVGGAHLRATFDRSDGGAYAMADCLSTAVEIGDVIAPTAPSTGLAVLAGTDVTMRVVVSPVNAASLFETDWEVARRKADFSYWNWIRKGTAIPGLQYAIPFPTGGIYKIQATARASFGERLALYRRTAPGPYDFSGIELENHIGVASTLSQLTIREFAIGLLGSTAFAKASPLPSLHGFSALPAEKSKCNAFVAHCAVSVGLDIPVQHLGRWLVSTYPPTANDWALGVSIDGWCYLGSGIDPEPGWIAAHPNTADHGHVGIVDYDGWEVGAGEKMVHRRFGPPMDGTTYFSTKENEP